MRATSVAKRSHTTTFSNCTKWLIWASGSTSAPSARRRTAPKRHSRLTLKCMVFRPRANRPSHLLRRDRPRQLVRHHHPPLAPSLRLNSMGDRVPMRSHYLLFIMITTSAGVRVAILPLEASSWNRQTREWPATQ